MTLCQLQQVAIHYATQPRPLTWLVAVGVAMTSVFSLADLTPYAPDATSPPLASPLFPLLCLSFIPFQYIRLHAVLRQFAAPQAALLPGYRKPHLLFLLLAAVLFLIASPCLLARLTAVSPWSLLALVSVLSVAAVFPAAMSLFVPLVILISLPDNAIDRIAPWMLAEGFRLPVLVATAVGSWLVIALHAYDASSGREKGTLLPLALLKKTDWRTDETRNERIGASREQPSSRRRSWASTRLDRQIRRMPEMPPFGKLRVGVARSANVKGSLWSLLPALPVGVLAIWQHHQTFSFDSDSLEWLVGTLPLLTLAAALAPALSLSNRLPQLSFERLLPTSNQTLADGLIYNSLRFSLIWWLAAHGGALAAIRLLPWETATPAPTTILAYGFVSFSSLLFSSGVALSVAPYPSFGAALLAGVAGGAACLGLPAFWSTLLPRESSSTVMLLASTAFLFGVALIAVARTNWREREYGSQ